MYLHMCSHESQGTVWLFLVYVDDLSDDICNIAIYTESTLYSKCDQASDL